MTENILEQRKKQITTIEAFLIPGTYYFDEELRILWNRRFQQDSLLENRQLDHELAGIVVGSGGNAQPLYHAVWFGINGDLKLFSENTVLTIASNQENFQRKLANQQHFHNFFKMPRLLTIDHQRLMTIEERLRGKMPQKAEMPLVFNTIQQDYLKYFQQASTDKVRFPQLLASSPNAGHRSEFQWLLDLLPHAMMAQAWPELRVHGDLWTENLLIDENHQLDYLDWDEAVPHIFFFDFFKLLWNELDVHGEASYLLAYLNGEFDEFLSSWFTHFGLTYEKEHRQRYMHLFFLDFLLRDTPSYPYTGKRLELLAYQQKVLPYFD